MRLATFVATAAEVAAASQRLDKTAKLATLPGELSGDEVAIAVGFLFAGRGRERSASVQAA